jgi:hypothetical protein
LVCEGPEDHYFFDKLIEARRLPRFHIVDAKGNGNFFNSVSGFRLTRPRTVGQITRYLFVADNDENPVDRFDNMRAQIEKLFGPGTAPDARGQSKRKVGGPEITILMIPWRVEPVTHAHIAENGHLECLCMPSARSADAHIAASVDQFMATIGADRWNDESRYGKAWLRSNLAARCASDPFVPLGHVFEKPKHADLIPIDHMCFDQITEFLRTFGP